MLLQKKIFRQNFSNCGFLRQKNELMNFFETCYNYVYLVVVYLFGHFLSFEISRKILFRVGQNFFEGGAKFFAPP